MPRQAVHNRGHDNGGLRIHGCTIPAAAWIGVDLNTTGHAVVAADPGSGRVLKLGKHPSWTRSQETKRCTKLYREGKLWRLTKMKSRERAAFRSTLAAIARQVVAFARAAGAGIKFEKIFSGRYDARKLRAAEYCFSFENASFPHLLRLVERRAAARGVPVAYVDPDHTSQTCSRCGATGKRMRKRFECPACGAVLHADINAAYNIAAAPVSSGRADEQRERCRRRSVRRLARMERAAREPGPAAAGALPGVPAGLFFGWEMQGVLP